MADCFIIMPITTPETLVAQYNKDKDHFLHVLEHLFIPALEKNKLNPIRPIAEGSDLIHAEIIRNLEKSDMVLCDASTLNANVFFELGIRTALNKPVAIVKDEHTPKIPFDLTAINHYTYNAGLPHWDMKKEVEALAVHVHKCLERSKGTNTMWKYYGLSTTGSLENVKGGVDEKVDMLSLQVEGLTHIVEKQIRERTNDSAPRNIFPESKFFKEIVHNAEQLGFEYAYINAPGPDKIVEISFTEMPPTEKLRIFKNNLLTMGYGLRTSLKK